MADFTTTPRLKIRSYDPARDEQNFVEVIFTYDNLRIGSRDLAPIRPNDRASLIETVNNSLFFAIVETLASPGIEAGQFVGSFALKGVGMPRNRTATLGIAFVKEHQNKGYGKEVLQFLLQHSFDHLGLHRVQLEVRANNDRAIALYRKVGFVQEGLLRKTDWLDGQWHDLVMMSVLAEDWLAQKANA